MKEDALNATEYLWAFLEILKKLASLGKKLTENMEETCALIALEIEL